MVMRKASSEVTPILQPVFLCLFIAVLVSCASVDSVEEAAKPAATVEPALTGTDRDEHRCIGSAGYRWCAQQTACVRPWELAEQEGIPNDAESFEQFCAALMDDVEGK
jgi:hypothetical protein